MKRDKLRVANGIVEEIDRLRYDLNAVGRFSTSSPLFVTNEDKDTRTIIMIPKEGVQEMTALMRSILLRELAKAEKRLEEL